MSNYLGIVKELQASHPEYFSGETNDLPSDCVPNQALTAKEAVQRAFHNLPSPCVANCPEDLPFDGYEEELSDLDQVRDPRFDSEMDVQDFHSTLLEKAAQACAASARSANSPEQQLKSKKQNTRSDSEDLDQSKASKSSQEGESDR